jgi:hypothetical protein
MTLDIVDRYAETPQAPSASLCRLRDRQSASNAGASSQDGGRWSRGRWDKPNTRHGYFLNARLAIKQRHVLAAPP